jgi:hypothetical protein
VYEGAEHPHEAQQPITLALGEVPKWDGLPKREPKQAPERASEGEPTRSRRPKKSTAKKSTVKARPGPKKSTASKSTSKKSAAKKSTARRTRSRKKE